MYIFSLFCGLCGILAIVLLVLLGLYPGIPPWIISGLMGFPTGFILMQAYLEWKDA